jgi:hypothetical protein
MVFALVRGLHPRAGILGKHLAQGFGLVWLRREDFPIQAAKLLC